MGVNDRDKAYFMDRVSREMEQDLGVLNLSPAEALAACCRILAREGHESGLAGQVTALREKPNTWWTLKFGLGFRACGHRQAAEDHPYGQGDAAGDGALARMAGASIEEATYLAVFFERAARMQIRAMAAGGFKEVKPELAEEACKFLLPPAIVRGTFAYWARR